MTKRKRGHEVSGKISIGEERIYYKSMFNGSDFCHDFTWDMDLSPDVSGDDSGVVPSWGGGVVDDGAVRMAVVMLAAAVGKKQVRGLKSYTPADFLLWDEMPAKYITKKYAQKFAKEVVSKLPNEWAMSCAKINKWIAKQEGKK